MKRILVIEDDPAILRGLEAVLGAEGYDVLVAADGEKGYQMARREAIDLILLDIMLPSKDGFEICRDLRSNGVDTPILILTSKQEEVDKVLGLELGADDYVTKPFAVRELLARVKARLRRATETVKDLDTCAFDDVAVDFRKQEARKNGAPVKLTAKEFEILKYFAQREGEVISRDALLDEVWGYEQFPTTRTVDNYILSLRKKIETDPSRPKHLLTVHTAGYKFVK